MIRYLSIPDLSATPARMPILRETVFPAILRAAREHKIDFALFPGDVHDTNFYLSKEYNSVLDFFAELMSICPVAGVCGTPGHETPDMYGALERIGFVLMRPGRVYGYGSEGITFWNIENTSPRCVLFGIPELIPSRIQSELGYASIPDYLREYVAPMRMQFESVPAIGVLHGTVSDCSQENESDPKRKSASVYVRTDDLAIADCTRWELGHIHAPWESSKICAGYAGSWSEDYGCLGFVPAMNFVTIIETRPGGVTETRISRVAYGTPERRKITHPLAEYDPNVAYWLHTTDPTIDTIGGHPWGRVTHEPQRIETRRVTAEQASGAMLPDLFRLIDPTVDEKTLELIKTLERSNPIVHIDPRTITVDRVDIEGCIFWGKPITLILDQLPSGLTQIMGANGEGKSSLAAFCTPYPVVVGKDTKSGRPSAIKDFFDAPESRIQKNIHVNGVLHYHIITIRGAHTQNPKVECSLVIDGVEILDRGTFDEMMTKCEELYGPYSDYLLTTFYVQPLQGKTGSSLMSATMTDIRDLVQAIAGIDREAQKRAALDNVATTEKALSDKESWLKGAQEFAIDVEELRKQIKALMIKEAVALNSITSVVESGKAKKAEYEKLIEKQKANENEKARKEADQEKYITQKGKKIAEIKAIRSLESVASQLSANQAAIASDDARIARMNARQEIENRNASLKNAWTERVLKIKVENNRLSNEYSAALSCYESDKAKHEATIANAGKVCEHCGKIPFANEAKQVEHARKALADLITPVKPTLYTLPIEPAYEPVPDYEPCSINRPELLAEIAAGQSARATIDAKREQISTINGELEILRAVTYTISDTIDAEVQTANDALESLRAQHTTLKAEHAAIITQADSLRAQITKAEEHAEQIKLTRDEIATLTDTLGRWKYIAVMLQPAKIPAMELDMVLDLIDHEATRNIEPYRDGAYSFSTRTQRQGKSAVVDAFDIRVHDNSTGIEKSFLEFSPGVKAFLNDAYVKALIRIRNQRSRITYSPIISDESDGPIQPELVPAYYEMQSRYYEGQDVRVLVISHAPDAHNYIGNSVAVRDLIRKEA